MSIGGVGGASFQPTSFDDGGTGGIAPGTLDSQALSGRAAFEEILGGGRPMMRGANGDDVRVLQEALDKLGHSPRGGVDGDFGRGTEQAIMAYQRSQGLVPSGRLDQATLARIDDALAAIDAPAPAPAPGSSGPRPDRVFQSRALELPAFEEIVSGARPPLERGADGPDVRRLQYLLGQLGHFPGGGIDGDFGPGTERALKAFQAASGLAQSGTADADTLRAMDARLGETGRDAALPAPDPLRNPPASYLASQAEREAYSFIERKLWTGHSWTRGIDLAVTNEDALAVMDRLATLDGPGYSNVLHALAATKVQDEPFSPTLLDKLIRRGTSDFGNHTLSDRFCDQLMDKLGGRTDIDRRIFSHISPDSVDRLRSWSGFHRLVTLFS